MSKLGSKNPNWKGGKITTICNHCSVKIEKYPSLIKKVNYCSISCSRKASKGLKLIELECDWCNTRYKKNPSELTKSVNKFCSTKCKGEWQQSDLNYYKDKISITRKTKKVSAGKNNPRWKGGITSLYDIIRKSPENKQWIQKVLKRDKFKCKITNSNKNLEVHHIIPFSKIIEVCDINKDNWKSFSHILFNINNGITLNKNEHEKARNKELILANYYRDILYNNRRI